jgi:hypothetical protein
MSAIATRNDLMIASAPNVLQRTENASP